MKIKNIYLSGAVALLMLGACEPLEQEVVTTLEASQIYESYSRTVTHATSVYTALPIPFTRMGGAMLASASDEAEHTL